MAAIMLKTFDDLRARALEAEAREVTLQARVAELTEALAASERLVDALRDDLIRFLGHDDAHICEGCGAPIDHDEEPATTDDVSGCWGYVADVKDAPCYRYRTKAGAERAWPACALLDKKGGVG